MRLVVIPAIMLILFASSSISISESKAASSFPENYLNMRFLDITMNKCFYPQVTSNSCVSASIQMVLDYLGYSPLPNQTQLANEMHTDINHTAQWRYVSNPFEKRGFYEFLNQSLSSDFDTALNGLKDNVYQNYPVIVNTWYDEQAKTENITHARIVIGYNLTGIFFHDPKSGPSQFMDNKAFADLWKTDLDYWAFIVEKEPSFDLTVQVADWFGNPISEVGLVLSGVVNDTAFTDLNGTARFSNLTMANYVFSYDWRFQSEKINLTLTRTESIKLTLFLSNHFILGILMISAITILVVAIVTTRRRRLH